MNIKTITHPSGDRLPLLLDQDGLPIPQPNEFILGRRALGENTLVRNMRELAIFYRWLDHQKVDFSSRVESKGKLFTEAEIKGSLVEALRLKQQSQSDINSAVSVNTFNQRLTTIRQYIVFSFDLVMQSLVHADNHFDRVYEHKKRLMGWIDSSFLNAPPESSGNKKGLITEEIHFLVNSLSPDVSDAYGRNPAVRFRNYISVLIMLNFGLRPGELLSLKVEDIVMGAISSVNIIRRPADINDKRNPRPQIKRNGRTLPIDDSILSQSLDEYIMTYRDELEAKSEKETDYLIISDEGEPLSQDTLGQLFRGLRDKFPKNLPSHLTPKALRHTFSSEMERTLRRAGMKEEHRSQALALLRGDSNLQSQNVYIAQEIEEQANQSLKNYQRKKLDEVKS